MQAARAVARGPRAGARVRRRHRRGARGGHCSTSSARAASTARRSRCRCRCPGSPVTLLDVGANAEARREHLVQFAFMGAALAQTVLGVERPRVGLLSNGEEAARGSPLVRRRPTRELRRARAGGRAAFEFVGNVEGGDVVGGRRRRDRDRRLHRQHRAEADGGRLADDARRGPRRGDVLDARRSSAGCCCAARCAAFATRSTRKRQGGAYLLGLRRLGVVPHGRFTRARLRAGDPARRARRARGHRRAAPMRALRAGGRAAPGYAACPRRTLACRAQDDASART